MVWLNLIAAALIITASGALLTVYADKLGDKLNISGAFIGLILLSMISSLPELGSTISVVSFIGKPDLAAGNIFGSNAFNLLILGILDFILIKESLFNLSKVNHNKSILLAALMTAIAILAIYSDGLGSIGGYAIEAPVIAATYLIGIGYLYLEEKKSFDPPLDKKKQPVWFEIFVVAGSGLAVVLAGYWLAQIADEIAILTGWGESFVGSIFLAISTSLPELVITLASLKLKAYDMAIANAVGSCFFNILMFPIADPFYKGDLLRDISGSNILLAVVTIAMFLVVTVSLRVGGDGRKTSASKYLLLGLYILGSWLVYTPS